MISGVRTPTLFTQQTVLLRDDSGRFLRVVGEVSEVSVPDVRGSRRFVVQCRFRRRLRILSGFRSISVCEVLDEPDDEPVNEEEYQPIRNHPEQAKQHSYFLLTGL
jgi:hypothetical protein